MGGLSFCFSNEPCIRKGTDFEWETDRRSAYQAEPVPFLIWGECPTARGQRPRAARRPHASSPSSASKNPCGKRAKPAEPQPGGQQPGRHSHGPIFPHYASTTISSFVSRAVCTSPSIFSSRFFSCLRITFRFGLVTGCFATKIVQQSSYGRIDVS